MFKPVQVRALPNYRLWIRYEDGIEGEVDLSHLIGKGIFSAWEDVSVFEQVTIGSSGELLWQDQVDLCADALYLQLTGKSAEEVFPT